MARPRPALVLPPQSPPNTWASLLPIKQGKVFYCPPLHTIHWQERSAITRSTSAMTSNRTHQSKAGQEHRVSFWFWYRRQKPANLAIEIKLGMNIRVSITTGDSRYKPIKRLAGRSTMGVDERLVIV